MNEPLETILKRMERSGHSEEMLISELVSEMICYRDDKESDDDLAQQIDDSMDEVIAAAKIIKAWAKVKGVPA